MIDALSAGGYPYNTRVRNQVPRPRTNSFFFFFNIITRSARGRRPLAGAPSGRSERSKTNRNEYCGH